MLKQLANFVDSVRLCGLLRPEQVEQIVAWGIAQNPDPQAIAKEIVQRGWLTAFQVKMFWKGRGQELFLNQYVLLDRLGEGGMGEVFHARHRRMDRDVALKVIRKERLSNPDAIKRFHREIKAAAALAHENIVMAYDADQAGGRHFFAMEYVDGTNLAQLVKEKGALPILQACDCIRQAALGLQHAFERGMVHRDIKPSNLLMNKNGVLKILDMGLARLAEPADGEQESRITQEGLVVGTPDFLAPEQARNARAADIRSDIYALGCTFYYILCAHSPYPTGTPTEKMLRHTTDPVPPLTRPDVPPQLVAIVQRMLAKNPDQRYQQPIEVAYALQPFTGPMPPGASALTPRQAQAYQAAPSTLAQAAIPTAAPLPRAPFPTEEPRTESQFRLPAPRPRQEPLAERSRWNLPIALGAGLIALGLLAGGAYLLFVKHSGSDGPTLDKQFRNRHDMAFALIPAGTFEMGSPDGEAGHEVNEGPVHAVKITHPFYLGTTEVTFRQYYSVVKNYPFAHKSAPEELDAPVTKVSMREVQNFFKLLNGDEQSRKPGWEYRLPTEAEWEYACRAGGKSRFSIGDTLSKNQANFNDPNAKGPGKVGQYPANAWGLHDMHGNAAEWVYDFYDDATYANSPAEDPKGPGLELRKTVYVVRGGGFLDPPDWCRSARRRPEKQEATSLDVGFRAALVPQPKQ